MDVTQQTNTGWWPERADFGEVKNRAQGTQMFKYTPEYNEGRQVTGITPGCGSCTRIQWNKEDKELTVTLEFQLPVGRTTTFRPVKQVTVTYDDGSMYAIPLTYTINP